MKALDSEEALSEINVVPLVDIILVVLIIFMVTAPMIMKPSLNVNLPKAASGDSTNPGKLNIALSKNGDIYLNSEKSSLEKISEYTKKLIETEPDTQAVISADTDVPHGRVVESIDVVKTAGVKKFAISTDKKAP